MALVVCLLPVFMYTLFVNVFSKDSNYTVNVIVLSDPVSETQLSLNSLCNSIIYCHRIRCFERHTERSAQPLTRSSSKCLLKKLTWLACDIDNAGIANIRVINNMMK